jgi:hypothetical protein
VRLGRAEALHARGQLGDAASSRQMAASAFGLAESLGMASARVARPRDCGEEYPARIRQCIEKTDMMPAIYLLDR